MRSIGIVACCLLTALSCSRNRPPQAPNLLGPNAARPGDTLVFHATASDPEFEDVAYKFAWGDTGSLEWSGYYISGQLVTRTHVFADTGAYVVRVMARDRHERESGWSESLLVRVSLLPPERPATPAGPAICTTGVRYAYVTAAHHPQADSVWFQFDWGGTVGDWQGPAASDSTFRVEHVFDTAGSYAVLARARDSRGLLSDWSTPIAVSAVDIPGGPPTGLALAAETDSTVRATWHPPVEGLPNDYLLYFKPVGGTGFDLVDTVADTTAVHDPDGATGTYRVSARFGSTVYEDTLTAGSVPVHTGTITVGELNGSDPAGLGWDRATGIARPLSMFDTLNAPLVDLYVTDFAAGSAGPAYHIASPDTAPFDPGGGAPPAPWRRVAIAGPLADEQAPLPAPGDTAWHGAVQLGVAPLFVGCRTDDARYGLVKVMQIRIANEDIRVQAWLQPVPGLRLLRH